MKFNLKNFNLENFDSYNLFKLKINKKELIHENVNEQFQYCAQFSF